MGAVAARIAALEAELVLLHHQLPTQADAALVRCGRRPIGSSYLPLLQLHPDVQALIVMHLATDTKDIAGARAFQAFFEDYRALRQLCHSARVFGGSSIIRVDVLSFKQKSWVKGGVHTAPGGVSTPGVHTDEVVFKHCSNSSQTDRETPAGTDA
jgi:hypothetical protein